jgi:GT2 family glycosyltransferase
MARHDRLSIIIVFHNNMDITLRCLETLSDSVMDIDHEVILIDNASTEDTKSLEEGGRFFRLFNYHRNTDNVSFSIANNQGVNEATGNYLLFLNNDVIVGRSSIRRLLNLLKNDKSIGIAGGKLLYPDKTRVQHAGVVHSLWGYPLNYGVGADPLDERVNKQCKRFAVTGAMLCTSQRLFQKLHGFDTSYFYGLEDIDLCLKIIDAGYNVVYDPSAVSIHYESTTLKETEIADSGHNYSHYRKMWGHILEPQEHNYLLNLKKQGIRRVVVFGTGMAARMTAALLDGSDIEITAFTTSQNEICNETFLDRPVLPLDSLEKTDYDRLMVASQFFFDLEHRIKKYDPVQEPVFPIF